MNDHPEDGVGYLTRTEWERLERAITEAPVYARWLRVAGHLKTGDPDELRVRNQGPSIPLPSTWLAADEIDRLWGELNKWPTLEQAVNTLDGQFFALMFTREVETATAKWPIEDKPHRVQYLRCRGCQNIALKYFPPEGAGKDITVMCTACYRHEDPVMFSRDAMLIEQEIKEARNGRGLDTSTQSA